MSERPDLSQPRAIHIIGIGGSGMSAIAEVLHGMGHRVTGSDLSASTAFDRLVAMGIRAVVGHSSNNIDPADPPDHVVRSTAIPDTNDEVIAARAAGLTVLHRSELLGAITSRHRTVAVAGTHGKTTTSSMLAVMARAADADPSFIIGGDVTELATGAACGTGDWFIVEADESDGTFLELGHEIGLITNVEPDHLEHYGGERKLREAFERFADLSEVVVACADDQGSRAVADRSNAVTYGQSSDATYRVDGIVRAADGSSFTLVRSGSTIGSIEVPMPGLHNALNAAGATAAALEMGLPFAALRDGLARFGGVGRRFQARGRSGGITFIDDYAHLPTEVRSALDAARDVATGRVVAVFQPHRYSRTEALWEDFTGAFDAADLLVVTDIYASGEAPRAGVTGALIVEAVARGDSPPETLYLPDRSSLARRVAPMLEAGDVCLTLGAGDSVVLPDELLQLLGTP